MRVPANRVSNAFRLLGSGELSMPLGPVFFPFGSQMPFGFWVLGNSPNRSNTAPQGSLKCLSAFGFWGTQPNKKKGLRRFPVSNAFRLLGSGEQLGEHEARLKLTRSQMPFGFWVLGNQKKELEAADRRVSLKCLSAFGFWGTYLTSDGKSEITIVSNAFRLLGSGEPLRRAGSRTRLGSLKCLSAFGFWGTNPPCSRS